MLDSHGISHRSYAAAPAGGAACPARKARMRAAVALLTLGCWPLHSRVIVGCEDARGGCQLARGPALRDVWNRASRSAHSGATTRPGRAGAYTACSRSAVAGEMFCTGNSKGSISHASLLNPHARPQRGPVGGVADFPCHHVRLDAPAVRYAGEAVRHVAGPEPLGAHLAGREAGAHRHASSSQTRIPLPRCAPANGDRPISKVIPLFPNARPAPPPARPDRGTSERDRTDPHRRNEQQPHQRAR
jgi:hypothetical protein